MLGKLVKNELKSYRFSFGIMFLAAVIFTVFMKIICMLPYQTEIKEMIQVFDFYAYYYLIMIVSVAAQILVIIRFYTTMVGDRGYLTWTLPAKSSTILWAKIIGGGLWEILATIVIFVLFAIYCVGNYWVGMEDVTEELLWTLQEIFGAFEPKYIVSILLAVITSFVWSFVPLMLIYLCMAVGQLFGKWRILASIGCYFVIMILLQILTVVGMVCMFVASDSFINIDFTDVSGFAIVNGCFLVMILIGCGIFAIEFAITNGLFKKHLNLE